MYWLRSIFWKKLLAFILALVMAVFLIFSLMPVAQAGIIENIRENLDKLLTPADDNPPSGRNTGLSGRGPICALPDEALTTQAGSTLIALVPSKQINDDYQLDSDTLSNLEIVGGFTTETQPTFLFYIPYILIPDDPSRRIAQFVLLDKAERPVWKELVSIELLNHPQLLEYHLPYDLKSEKLYTWYFSVICDTEKRSRNPAVRGWIQQIEPTSELQTKLRMFAPVDWNRIYIENGIWFEAVSSLINNRRNFPRANQQDWNDLLTYFKVIEEEEDTNQSILIQLTEPVYREEVEVNGNQLPARM